MLDQIGRALRGIVALFLGMLRYLELKTVIPVIEGLMRLWYHLDPRVYSEALRIRQVTDGNVDKKSNKYALLVLYANSPLPRFTTNLIDAIGRTPFNLVIVSNGPLDTLLRAQLLENCYLLIERANLGRDFGGYKDGISIVLQRFGDVDRLILVNDSLFFFQRGLDRLIAELDGPHDFVGVTEVFEHHYHVQSYMLSFGPRAIRHKRFLQYWRRYRPISTRRWSIHKGEVGLTRRMTRAGFQPHVLFDGTRLIAYLRDRSVADLLATVRLLPTHFRLRLYQRFQDLYNSELPDPSTKKHAATVEKWLLERFATQIVSTITTRNQVHVGGFLFMKHLGLPLIKRDVFYREVYALEDIYEILTDLNEPVRDEVMADLRRTGTSLHLNPFFRLLYRHGSI